MFAPQDVSEPLLTTNHLSTTPVNKSDFNIVERKITTNFFVFYFISLLFWLFSNNKRPTGSWMN